jgi:hypothetical protein
MRIAAALAPSILLLAASACGGHHAAGSSGDLSVSEVERAFKEAGAPLQQGFELNGVVTLIPPDGSVRYSAMVFTTHGIIGVRSQASDVNEVVRNVVVAYRPSSPAASRVRAAISRLRRNSG